MKASPHKTHVVQVEREGVSRPRVLARKWLLLGAAFATAAMGFWIFAGVRQALDKIEQARSLAGARDVVPFERKRLSPLRMNGVRLFQSTLSARAVERFNDSYFVATDGGLLELSPRGQAVRRFNVLDGLAESDLTSLAAFNGRLYVGTRSKGLLTFDGERFEQYVWPDRDAKTITALAVDQEKLLVGTFGGGLLSFDGDNFKELRAGEGDARLDAVTFAARRGSRLYVGTFNAGLWVEEGARWAHYTSSDGLASERIIGVVEIGGQALAASDFGLSSANADGLVLAPGASAGRAWQSVLTVPSLSGIGQSNGRVVLCKDDGEFAALDIPRGGASAIKAQEIDWTKPRGQRSGARLAATDSSLWLLDSGGLRRSVEAEADQFRLASSTSGADAAKRRVSFEGFGEDDSPQSLTSNVVSALAFDSTGRLWAGSFREGVDVFAPDGARIAHVESDELRETNALAPDGAGGVLASTSQGLFHIAASLRVARLDGSERQSGGAVTQVAQLTEQSARGASSTSGAPSRREKQSPTDQAKQQTDDQLAVATPKGLSLVAQGHARVLTTVQGLPSNSVYSVLPFDGRVYAGTLGGFAEISSGRVARVFKDSNSALKVNWVTALCGAAGRVFVGTYGGGVFELLPSGDLRAFGETARAFVNQNAIWSDEERLYVGTLDGALVFDLQTQKWTRVRDELPSATVLSVAGRSDQIYFGTTAGLARFDKKFFDKSFLDASE
ncbi:MAG: hypothetical protein DMF67_01675 [Acidobacteria bacterium]|nr:MAG: hypothetical protein DMF67_01675 [Acidobacteriota bacterium]